MYLYHSLSMHKTHTVLLTLNSQETSQVIEELTRLKLVSEKIAKIQANTPEMRIDQEAAKRFIQSAIKEGESGKSSSNSETRVKKKKMKKNK